MASVLLSALVERCLVSRMRDFLMEFPGSHHPLKFQLLDKCYTKGRVMLVDAAVPGLPENQFDFPFPMAISPY